MLISDKESQKQSDQQSRRLQHSMGLVALSRLVPGRYDVCPGATGRQVAAAELACEKCLCWRDRGPVLR
jgi:hypothetical protein